VVINLELGVNVITHLSDFHTTGIQSPPATTLLLC